MRFTEVFRDELQRPLVGALAYVYLTDGVTLASGLTTDAGLALTNPVIADAYGAITLNGAGPQYLIDVFFFGRRVWKEKVGDPAPGPVGPQGNLIPYATYASLAAVTTLPVNTGAMVVLADAGMHTDPVVGGTVGNSGIYRYSTAPAGWQRLGAAPIGLTGAAGSAGTNGGIGSSAGNAALFTGISGMAVGAGITSFRTAGYAVAGKGAAEYFYDAAVNAAYVTANSQTSGLIADGRGFRLAPQQQVSVAMFGAIGDGVADDRIAIIAADGFGELRFPVGSYLISTSVTIVNDVAFAQGAKLVIPTGVTVTFTGSITATTSQIFQCTGTGAVVLNRPRSSVAYPEWWGAPAAGDCFAAITAALNCGLPLVKLARRDYQTTATILVPAYTRLEGTGQIYEGSTATRLLGIGGSIDVVQLGTTVYPGSLNACIAGCELANMFVARNTNPASSSDCNGVRVGYSRFAKVENVWSDNSINGFRFFGSITAIAKDCRAKRSVVSSTNPGDGTLDKWFGFYVDGSSVLSAAGSNASLRLSRCSAELNVVITNATALRLDVRFTDTFLDDFETVGAISVPIDIQGDSAGTPNNASNTDVTLRDLRIDQSTVYAIRVQNVNKWGSIKIIEPYIGPTAGGGIYVQNCLGHVGITGGQLRMDNTAGVGVTFDTCRAPVIDGTAIIECRSQAVALMTVTAGRIAPVTENATQILAAAVQLISGCTDTVLDAAITGDAAKVANGYQSLNANNDRNDFRLTKVTPGVCTTLISLAAGSEPNSIFAGPTSPNVQAVASAATVTPVFGNDLVKITAQAVALTLANPTGTAVPGVGLAIRIKDNATARAISFGTQYRALGVTLPTMTVASKTLYVGLIYNADDTKWDVVAVAQEA